MPVGLRTAKARKLAYRVMGVPINMLQKPSERQQEINKRLWYDLLAREK